MSDLTPTDSILREINQILDDFSSEEAILNSTGTGYTPTKWKREWQAIRDKADRRLLALITEANMQLLNKVHRANNAHEIDNETDEYIDQVYDELEASLTPQSKE